MYLYIVVFIYVYLLLPLPSYSSNEICKKRKRSTVYPDDVLDAVHELEFEELVRPLEQYLSSKCGKQEQDQSG